MIFHSLIGWFQVRSLARITLDNHKINLNFPRYFYTCHELAINLSAMTLCGWKVSILLTMDHEPVQLPSFTPYSSGLELNQQPSHYERGTLPLSYRRINLNFPRYFYTCHELAINLSAMTLCGWKVSILLTMDHEPVQLPSFTPFLFQLYSPGSRTWTHIFDFEDQCSTS